MINVIENFHDASGKAVQPYFTAFMLERGYIRADEPFKRDGHNCEYMEWNSARWREFEHSIGQSTSDFSDFRGFYRDKFSEWLNARAIDHAARAFCEAGGSHD